MSGVTIVELIAVLAIAAVLAGLAFPSMTRVHQQHQSAAVLNQLIAAINLTRHSAVTLRTSVTLCPSDGGIQCAGRDQWHRGAIVFTDGNRNGWRDEDEALIRAFAPLPAGARVYWRSFGNRNYLQMMPTGFTNWQNGNFLYCPSGNDSKLARSVIVNAQGRARVAHDANGDGTAQDAQGRPLTCP
jgi:type IV fimbrial biogenesis protein FimT